MTLPSLDPSTTHDAVNADTGSLRRTIAWVAALNLAYFGVEFTVAILIGSVSLFADSIDFLEDTALNGLVLMALAWSGRRQAALGKLLALLLLVPGSATLWTAGKHWTSGHVPPPLPLTLTGLGALLINLGCALLLARVRHTRGSLTRAAFLSARNDTIASAAIILAGALTALTRAAWPDLVTGLGIFLMNADAAREVYLAARRQYESPLDRA